MSSHPTLLGALIAPNAETSKDAIHCPIAPFIAGDLLAPGQSFKVVAGVAVPSLHQDAVGIVDPFLRLPVPLGERFWGLIIPGLVTKLRHEWECSALPQLAPAKEVPAPEDPEITKLRDYMAERNVTADTVISDANYARDDSCRGCY